MAPQLPLLDTKASLGAGSPVEMTAVLPQVVSPRKLPSKEATPSRTPQTCRFPSQEVTSARSPQTSGNILKTKTVGAATLSVFSPTLPMEDKTSPKQRQLRGRSRRSSEKNVFEHGRMTSAQTLGEVHLLLQRPACAAPPPSDAKAFKQALVKKFGKLEYAWEDMDSNGDGALQFNEFVRACRNMQFGGNLRKIFDDLTDGQEALTPEALEPGLQVRLDRFRARSASKDPFCLEKGADFQGYASAQTLGEVHMKLQRADARSPPPSDAKAFKQALWKKFGKLEYAWEEIDQNGDGALQFHEFVRACRSMQFCGNLRKVFDDLAGGNDVVTPEMLDPGLPARLEKRAASTARSLSREPSMAGSIREGSDFQVGNSAQTLGEVHMMLQRSSSRSPPPSSVKAFKQALLKKFGKMEYAWDAIDLNGDNAIQFHEFVRACRSMQFNGNLRRIFDELSGGRDVVTSESLDSDLPARLEFRKRSISREHSLRDSRSDFHVGSSAQTLGEVHLKLQYPGSRSPPPATAKAFKQALLKKFGKFEYAWVEMDGNGDGVLQFHEFVRACRNMQFNGNIRRIFDELTGGEDVLTPERLDPGLEARIAKCRLRTPSASIERGSDFQGGSSCQTLGEMQAMLARPDPGAGPPSDAKAFKQALLKKFGKMEYAWEEIDSNKDGSLQFHEFVRACRNMQFSGNLRKIFDELTGGKDVLTPGELDVALPSRLEKRRMSSTSREPSVTDLPRSDFQAGFSAQTLGEVHQLLQRSTSRSEIPCNAKAFKEALLKKFGKLEYAWQDIDANGDGALQFNEFVRACRNMQFSGNLRKIFDELAGGNQVLSPDALQPGLSESLARYQASCQARRRSSSRDTLDAGASFEAGSSQTLGEVHMKLNRLSSRSPPPSDARAFKQALLKKFGKLEYAWKEIDLNGDGALQFHEFVRACRHMQFSGNFRKIFDELTGGNEDLTPDALQPGLSESFARCQATCQARRRSSSRDPLDAGVSFEAGSSQTLGEVHMKLNRLSSRSPPPSDARAFKQALLKKFGKLEYAWDEIDLNGDGALQFHEFVRACRHMQFSGNFRKIFDELTGGNEDLTPDALQPGLSESLARCKANCEARRRSSSRDPLDEGADFQRGSAQTLGEVHLKLQRPEARAPPPCNVKDFRAALLKKYGKLECAWNKIDANRDGALQFNEFVRSCRSMDFGGNLRKIFNDMAPSGEMSPDDLQPGLSKRLQDSPNKRKRLPNLQGIVQISSLNSTDSCSTTASSSASPECASEAITPPCEER